MTTYTTITDLTAAVRDLRPDMADLITTRHVQRARSNVGQPRYEDIDSETLSTITDLVAGEVESQGLSGSAPVDGAMIA